MDQNQFSQLFPHANNQVYVALSHFLPQYNITNETMFYAQCSEESGRLTQFSENLNYSAHQLQATWPSHFTATTAPHYAYQPQKLANYVYAGMNGNGNEASGDGWTYRGRGLIQITGKYNYQSLANDLNYDLNATVIYLSSVPGAVESACWFWTKRIGATKYPLRADVPTVTKLINGSYTNLSFRYAEFDRIHAVTKN
jgi:putative chitinase